MALPSSHPRCESPEADRRPVGIATPFPPRLAICGVAGCVFLPLALLASASLGAQDLGVSSADKPRRSEETSVKPEPPPVAVASAQAEAIAKHPALGNAGSAFNREFLARMKRYQADKPDFFRDERWPLNLADEVAAAGFASVAAPAGSGAPAAASGVNRASSRIQLLNRTAVPPADAPPVVLRAVEAGNTLQTKGYKFGGGRDQLEDSGYDCSGTVSYVLIKAGLLKEPRTSRSFATFGESGPGRWITVFASPGHVFVTLCGLRLDTGGRGGMGGKGPRWNPYPRPSIGYVLRHPPGF